MQEEIPIKINKTGSIVNQRAFEIFPLKQPSVKKQKRHFNSLRNPRSSFQAQRYHQTLDANGQKPQQHKFRKRTISTGTSRKFPKDFFKENFCTTPLKSRQSREKKEKQTIQSGKQQKNPLFTVPINDLAITFQCRNSKEVQSQTKISEQLLVQPCIETPKFKKNKKQQQNNEQSGTRIQFKQSENKKIKKSKLQEYFNFKKEQVQGFLSVKQHKNQEIYQNNINKISTTNFRSSADDQGYLFKQKLNQSNKAARYHKTLRKIKKQSFEDFEKLIDTKTKQVLQERRPLMQKNILLSKRKNQSNDIKQMRMIPLNGGKIQKTLMATKQMKTTSGNKIKLIRPVSYDKRNRQNTLLKDTDIVPQLKKRPKSLLSQTGRLKGTMLRNLEQNQIFRIKKI